MHISTFVYLYICCMNVKSILYSAPRHKFPKFLKIHNFLAVHNIFSCFIPLKPALNVLSGNINGLLFERKMYIFVIAWARLTFLAGDDVIHIAL